VCFVQETESPKVSQSDDKSPQTEESGVIHKPQAHTKAESHAVHSEERAPPVFARCSLPAHTTAFSFPEGTTALNLQGSKFKYVSAVVYKSNNNKSHTLNLCDKVSFSRKRSTENGHLGAIAIQEKPSKTRKSTLLDVEFVVISAEMVARAVKPSALLFPDGTDDNKASTTTELSDSQKKAVVAAAGQWAHKTHVLAVAKRHHKVVEMQIDREKQRELRSQSQTTEEQHRAADRDLSSALTAALAPMVDSIAVLHANQLQLTRALQSPAPAHSQTQTTPQFTHVSPSSVSPVLFDPSVLSSAFAHSQLAALHLAQQSVLLSSAIAPLQMKAAQTTNIFSQPRVGLSEPNPDASFGFSPETLPRGRKRRRKTIVW
jgi:hypothetical protein